MSSPEDEIQAFIATFQSQCDENKDRVDGEVQLSVVKDNVSKALSMTNLAAVEISGTKDVRFIDNDIAILVNSLIGAKISLEALVLKHHRISDVGLIQICQLILPNTYDICALKELNVEGNDIGSIGCNALQECLEAPQCELAVLAMGWNPLRPEGGMALAAALEVIMQYIATFPHVSQFNSSVVSLSLENCGFDLSTLISIANGVSRHPRLEYLSLDRPTLSSTQQEGIDHISRAITAHPAINTISLKYHRINDFGASLLATAFTTNTSLLVVNLEGNNICVGGAEALATHLIQVNRLQALLLSHNRVCDDGAKALAAALRSNTSLQELTLKHNEINVRGLTELGNALYKNNTLRFLSLWGNAFEMQSCHLFYDLCEQRLPYTGLSLDIQPYIVDGVHYVAERSL